MTIGKTLSNVTRGAELNKPELSLNYILAATVGIVVLMFAWKAGNAIFAKGNTLVQGSIPGGSTPDFKTALGIV
jgi:hypothetical protein